MSQHTGYTFKAFSPLKIFYYCIIDYNIMLRHKIMLQISESANPPISMHDWASGVPNHVPWRAKSMQVFIPTNYYTSWFHQLVPSTLVEGVLISEISRSSDWLEWKPAYSRSSVARLDTTALSPRPVRVFFAFIPLTVNFYHYGDRIYCLKAIKLSICITYFKIVLAVASSLLSCGW